MSEKDALRKLVVALGGKGESVTSVGLLGEISAVLGGVTDGKTVSEQICNIAAVVKKPTTKKTAKAVKEVSE